METGYAEMLLFMVERAKKTADNMQATPHYIYLSAKDEQVLVKHFNNIQRKLNSALLPENHLAPLAPAHLVTLYGMKVHASPFQKVQTIHVSPCELTNVADL